MQIAYTTDSIYCLYNSKETIPPQIGFLITLCPIAHIVYSTDSRRIKMRRYKITYLPYYMIYYIRNKIGEAILPVQLFLYKT